MVPPPDSVFRYAREYAQNAFGLLLASFALFSSCCLFRVRVVFLTWFLARLYKTRCSGPLYENWYACHSPCHFFIYLDKLLYPHVCWILRFPFPHEWNMAITHFYNILLRLSHIMSTSPSTRIGCSSKYTRAPTKSSLP